MIKTRETGSGISIGDHFGRMTVLGQQWRSGKYWRVACQCDCGKITTPFTHCIGKTTFSCGCLARENASKTMKAVFVLRQKRGDFRPESERTKICCTCFRMFCGQAGKNSQHCSRECRADDPDTNYTTGGRKHKCKGCGERFTDSRSFAQFCSVECHNIWQTGYRVKIECRWCHSKVLRRLDHGRTPKFCCRNCFNSHVNVALGDMSSAWKGGEFTLSASDFRMLYQGAHKHGLRHRPEHRIVAEGVLGRRLEDGGEPIVHLNGNNSDNRPENLFVFPSHGAMLRMLREGHWPDTSNLVS